MSVPSLQPSDPSAKRLTDRLLDQLGLKRNVAVMSTSVFLLGAGQELWNGFLPKYLDALGASATVVGLFGTAKDFLDGVYQYPGGLISDKLGTKRALTLFSCLAMIGYAVYAGSRTWHTTFIGLAFVMAWTSMASPAMFALIAEQLPRERRAMGFTFQAILKRVPVVFSPALGGLLIASLGLLRGIRLSLLITIGLTIAAILAQWRLYIGNIVMDESTPVGLVEQFRDMHSSLKKLLLSDILIRTCEGMTGVFIVLFVLNVTGASAVQFGLLTGIQMASSIVAYLPAAKLADRFGRKPFVTATFICFSLFPVAVALSHGFFWLVLAFMIGGLRELGEPARKAMIVDLCDPSRRGRTVGLYYLTRSLSITPAAVIGGLLWKVSPQIPFFVAGAIGLIGTAAFVLRVRSQDAS